jgi:hypothetical protein
MLAFGIGIPIQPAEQTPTMAASASNLFSRAIFAQPITGRTMLLPIKNMRFVATHQYAARGSRKSQL